MGPEHPRNSICHDILRRRLNNLLKILMSGAFGRPAGISGLITLDNISNCLEPSHGSPPMAFDLLHYYLKYLDEAFLGLPNDVFPTWGHLFTYSESRWI